jgi:phage terminase small subunit
LVRQPSGWELFCQAIVSGQTAGDAYVAAGYKRSNSSPYLLLENPRIKERIDELRTHQVERLIFERKALIARALENVDIAMGKKPVRVGKEGTEIYVYRGDVANRALQMLGSELGLFVGRSEHKHTIGEFDKFSDAELAQILIQEAQMLLLTDQSGGDERNVKQLTIGQTRTELVAMPFPEAGEFTGAILPETAT